jgi:hypothetical protein
MVASHLAWYAQYQHLLDEKKVLVNEWRTHRSRESLHAKAALEAAAVTASSYWNNDDGENQRGGSNRTQPLNENSVGGISLKSHASSASAVSHKEREAQRKALSEWKARKEADARTKRETQQAERQAKAERDLAEKLKRARTKELLTLRKLQLESVEPSQNLNSPSCNSSTAGSSRASHQPNAPTKAQLKARQQRDHEIALNRRRAKLKAAKPSRQEIIEQKVVRNVPVAKRDANRLVKPTRAWEAQAMTDEQVVEGQRRRDGRRAHEAVVASTAGASKAGRGYSIGVVQGAVGGRAVASWRSVR